MSRAQLTELADAGWEIGSHTCSHPRLTTVDDETLERELRASKEALGAWHPLDRVSVRRRRRARDRGRAPGRLRNRGLTPEALRLEGQARLAACRRLPRRRSAPLQAEGVPAHEADPPLMRARARKFLSSTFNQPLGTRVADGGYHIDLRVKARSSDLPSVWPWEPGTAIVDRARTVRARLQRALGGRRGRGVADRGTRGGGDAARPPDPGRHLGAALRPGAHVRPARAVDLCDGAGGGREPAHAAGRATGDERYAEAAARAIEAMPMAPLPDGSPFPQEYHRPALARPERRHLRDPGPLRHRRDRALRGGARHAPAPPAPLGHRQLVALRPLSASDQELGQPRLPRAAHDPAPRAHGALGPHALDEAADRFESYWSSRAYRGRALAHKAAFRIACRVRSCPQRRERPRKRCSREGEGPSSRGVSGSGLPARIATGEVTVYHGAQRSIPGSSSLMSPKPAVSSGGLWMWSWASRPRRGRGRRAAVRS